MSTQPHNPAPASAGNPGSSSHTGGHGDDPSRADRNKSDQHRDEVATKDPAKLSEADYLLRQQEDAKAAIGATLGEMSEKLREVVDLRLWTQHYPFITTTLAAGAGFLAALALVPKDKHEAKAQWEKLKHAFVGGSAKLYDAQGNEYVEARPPAVELRSDPPPAPKPGMLGTLIQEAIKTIRPAIVSFITAGVTAKAEQEGPRPGEGTAPAGTAAAQPSAGSGQYS